MNIIERIFGLLPGDKDLTSQAYDQRREQEDRLSREERERATMQRHLEELRRTLDNRKRAEGQE